MAYSMSILSKSQASNGQISVVVEFTNGVDHTFNETVLVNVGAVKQLKQQMQSRLDVLDARESLFDQIPIGPYDPAPTAPTPDAELDALLLNIEELNRRLDAEAMGVAVTNNAARIATLQTNIATTVNSDLSKYLVYLHRLN